MNSNGKKQSPEPVTMRVESNQQYQKQKQQKEISREKKILYTELMC